MLSDETLNELFTLINGLKTHLNLNEITFSSGQVLDKTATVARQICPYSKVVVIYEPCEFERVGEELTSLLINNGLTPINLILDNEELQNNQEIIVNSLPENTRLIITVDDSHIYNAQALAKERGIECVIGLTAYDKRLFKDLTPPPTHFIFDRDLKICEWQVYSVVVSKIIALLDIKLKQFFKIICKNPEQTDLFVEILDKGINIIQIEKSKRNQKLVTYAVSLELIEVALKHISIHYDLKTSLCIIKLISQNLTKEYINVPNYLKRAEKVSELYGLNYLATLEGFVFHLKKQKEYEKHLVDIKKGLGAIAREYLKYAPKIIYTFKEFNGEFNCSNNQILQTLKYAGDIHYYNNSMSLLRETGFLEKIKV